MGAAGSGSQRTAAGGAAVEESEDRRIKLLTESVLYDLLPAALQIMLPQTGEEAAQQEPDMDKCRVSEMVMHGRCMRRCRQWGCSGAVCRPPHMVSCTAG